MSTTISNDLNDRLAVWSENFAKTLGDSLQSIVLYGGLAKGEFVPGQSDVNILIVFRSVAIEVLDRAAPQVRQGALEFRLAAMLATEADLRDLADVFPIKFQDMQRRHKVLWGEDPFPKVTVPREHLRLRCEQELHNLSLRLRQGYVQRTDRPELLQAALSRAVSSLLVNLGVLLELKTGKPAENKQDALANATQLGISLEPLQQAWALKRGEFKPDSDGLKKLFASFMNVVQQAADLAGKPS
jgi:predicted nucleotidyltransferase